MANTYLSATLGTATNRKKWTFSAWVKKSRPFASIDEANIWFLCRRFNFLVFQNCR